MRHFIGRLIGNIKRYLQLRRDKKSLFAEVMNIASNGRISDSERSKLEGRIHKLGLTAKDLAPIRQRAYITAFRAVSVDGSVSAEQETGLQEIERFLEIPVEEISREKDSLTRFRLLFEIRVGHLPTLSISDLILRKGEVVHWREPAALLEMRVVGRRYEGGSHGVSFRIAKGVSYRVGAHRGRLITDKALVQVATGEFLITNRRTLFRGAGKAFDLNLEKLMGINFADDGLMLTVANREKPFVIQFNRPDNVSVVKAILSAAMNQLAA